MTIRFACLHCGSSYELPDHLAERRARCTRCGRWIVIRPESSAENGRAAERASDDAVLTEIELASDGGRPVPQWLAKVAALLGGGPLELYRRIHRGGVLMILFGVVFAMTGLTPQPQLHAMGSLIGDTFGTRRVALHHLSVHDPGPWPHFTLTRFAPAGAWYVLQLDADDGHRIQGAWLALKPTHRSIDDRHRTDHLAAVVWLAGEWDERALAGQLVGGHLPVSAMQRGLPDDLTAALAEAGVLGEADPQRVWLLHRSSRPPGADPLMAGDSGRAATWPKAYLALGLASGAVGLFLVIGTLVIRPVGPGPRGRAKVVRVFSVIGMLVLAAVVIGRLGRVYTPRIEDILQAGQTGMTIVVSIAVVLWAFSAVWSLGLTRRYEGWGAVAACVLFPPYWLYHLWRRWDYQQPAFRGQLAAWVILLIGSGFGVLGEARAAYRADQEAQWRLSLPPRLQMPGMIDAAHSRIDRPASRPMGKLIVKPIDLPESRGDDVFAAPDPVPIMDGS